MSTLIDTCPIHGIALVVIFDHVKGVTYRYCPCCQPVVPPLRLERGRG